jgi:signal transduction histidine kinase
MGGRFRQRRSARATWAEVERLERIASHNAIVLRCTTDSDVIAGNLRSASMRVTRELADECGVERVSVWMLSEDLSELLLINLFESTPRKHSDGVALRAADYPSYFEALATGRAIDAHDARAEPRTREFTDGYLVPLGITSMLDATVRVGGKVVGVVCNEHVGPARRWTPEEATLAAELADIVAQTILNRERRIAEERVRELASQLERRVRRRTAELEAANRELQAFGYSVSHDLRTPIRHVHSYATILREDCGDKLGPAGREQLDRIAASATRMEALVEGLLALSKLGRQAIAPKPVDIEELVHSVWTEIGELYDVSPVTLEIGSLPPCTADPMLLRQVWVNLLDNAVKYSAVRANPTIRVDSVVRDRRCWYRVTDNGVGFDPQYKDKLFGVFERLHSTDEFDGVGVGLALVKRIIDKHAGDLAGDSDGESGCVFEFTV